MRRAFVGVWCWPHAALIRALAVVITGTVGWLGIPFGLVFTPLALFKLAQGGDKPADANRELLMAIGEQKLKAGGNPREGIRCLEAALEFGENPGLETLLREQSVNLPPQTRDAPWPTLVVFPALLLVASLMGLVVGMLDYYLTFLLSGIGDGWLIRVIIWLPLIGGLFVSGLLGSIILEAALIRTRTHHRLLGIGLGILAALMLVYASLSGERTAYTILSFSTGYVTSAPISATLAIGGSLMWGGLDILYGYVSDGGTLSLFILGGVLVMGTLTAVANVTAALRVTVRQGRVNAILGTGSGGFPMGLVTGWLGMMACLVVCGALLAGTYLTSQFQFGEPAAIERFSQGMDLLENGDAEGARALLMEARSIDPASPIPYFGLAAIELEHGNCQQGLDTIAIGSAGAPSALQPMVHAFIGAGYECMYRIDDAILSLEKSLELNPNLPEVVVRLSSLYYATADYDRSIELLLNAQEQRPEWVTPYAGLAMIYYETGQPDKAEEAIATARSLAYEDWTDPIMIAGYYSMTNDFATAEEYTREALAEVPGNPGVQASLGSLLSLQGKLDESLEVADDILAGQLHHEDAYLVRSAVFFMKEDLEASLAELEKADEISPNDPEVLSSQALTYYFLGDYEKALEKSQASLSINKYSASGFRAQALLYLAQGRDKAALEAATRSVELAPRSDLSHYVLGMLAYQRGDEATAVAEFELFLATTWDRPYVREMQAEAQRILDELGK
jgi:tetratricopeptide (TPR) repeat protein